MKSKNTASFLLLFIVPFSLLFSSCATHDGSRETHQKDRPLRLVFITTCVHEPFFDSIQRGMHDAADMLDVECEFIGTEGVDVPAQAKMVQQAVQDGYDGIALNIIDPEGFDTVIQEAIDAGVAVVGFNVDDHATANARLSSVNQQLYEAGKTLAEHVQDLVPEKAHVLMTMHDEGISALEDRLNGMREVLEEKNVTSTVAITTNDPAKGAEIITATLKNNPEIRVILGTGEADTEAAGMVIRDQFADQGYLSAGFDLSEMTLELIRQGHIHCTIDQQPYVQGFYPVVQLTHYLRYGLMPSDMDAGATIIDRSNVDQVSELAKQNYR